MLIDILIPVAERGGVENIIKMFAHFAKEKLNWRIRVIQLVWEGYAWLDESEISKFVAFNYGKGNYDAKLFIEQYSEFLMHEELPDIILASVWPLSSLIARRALEMVPENRTLIVSWGHAPVEEYARAGFGGYECLKFADVQLAISDSIYLGIKQNVVDARPIKVKNPVKLDKSNLVIKRNDNACNGNLLFVGRISEEKNLETVFRALTIAKQWKLRIVGSGEVSYVKKIEEYAKKLGIDSRVEFLGWQEKPWECAMDMDALVLSSLYEGFPLTAIESLAYGIPVIATPVSGIVELISPGENGYLFSKQNEQELADILVCMKNGTLPAILSSRCTESVRRFDKEKALKDFCIKLEELKNVFGSQEFDLCLENMSDSFFYESDVISVIVPCHNVENEIAKCIDSILDQEFPDENYEVILVDDASDDNTVEVLRDYEGRCSDRIALIQCEDNSGPGGARNIGMQYANGNYLVFVDSDDWIDPDYIDKLYRKIKLYNCEMVGCGYRKAEDGVFEDVVSKGGYYDLSDEWKRREHLIKYGCMNSTWRYMYDKKFLLEHNICFLEKKKMEDLPFVHKCFLHSKKIYELNDVLYNYRINTNGIMRSLKQDEIFDIATTARQLYNELCNENLLLGVEKEYEFLYFMKAIYDPYLVIQHNRSGIKLIEEDIQREVHILLSMFPNFLENPYLLQCKNELHDVIQWIQKYE